MSRKKLSRNAQRLLTVSEILAAKNGDHSDGGGLYLRVRAPSASWVFRYTSALGKRREMGLGRTLRHDAANAGESIRTARGDADAARLLVASGKDPIDQRANTESVERQTVAAAKAVAKAESITLARASRSYHEKFVEPHRTPKHAALWIASLENHVPKTLWDRAIASITAGELLDLLVELFAKVPETATRIRQRLDAIFDDAILRGIVDKNPAAAVRRKLREVGSKRRETHFRSLDHSRIPRFMQAVENENGIAAKAMRVLVLTATRTRETLLASWPEFDLDARLWIIPAARMKGNEDHVIFLSDPAVAILRALKDDPSRDPLWVFASPMNNGNALSNMALLVLLRRMGLQEETTTHGMRSSFSTWANERGCYRNDVIEACLAHQEADRVRRAYNRAQFTEERKRLLEDWAAYCCGVKELKDAA